MARPLFILCEVGFMKKCMLSVVVLSGLLSTTAFAIDPENEIVKITNKCGDAISAFAPAFHAQNVRADGSLYVQDMDMQAGENTLQAFNDLRKELNDPYTFTDNARRMKLSLSQNVSLDGLLSDKYEELRKNSSDNREVILGLISVLQFRDTAVSAALLEKIQSDADAIPFFKSLSFDSRKLKFHLKVARWLRAYPTKLKLTQIVRRSRYESTGSVEEAATLKGNIQSFMYLLSLMSFDEAIYADSVAEVYLNKRGTELTYDQEFRLVFLLKASRIETVKVNEALGKIRERWERDTTSRGTYNAQVGFMLYFMDNGFDSI
jgi:hypothetical protein